MLALSCTQPAMPKKSLHPDGQPRALEGMRTGRAPTRRAATIFRPERAAKKLRANFLQP